MSKRILRINELLQQEISKILLRELEVPEGCLVTIIKAETTSDLKEAKILISIFPFNKKEYILNFLKKIAGKIQFFLNKKIAINPLPRIRFCLDETEEKANRVEEILNSLEKN